MEIIKSKRKTHLFLHEKAENVMKSSKIQNIAPQTEKVPPPLHVNTRKIHTSGNVSHFNVLCWKMNLYIPPLPLSCKVD